VSGLKVIDDDLADSISDFGHWALSGKFKTVLPAWNWRAAGNSRSEEVA